MQIYIGMKAERIARLADELAAAARSPQAGSGMIELTIDARVNSGDEPVEIIINNDDMEHDTTDVESVYVDVEQ